MMSRSGHEKHPNAGQRSKSSNSSPETASHLAKTSAIPIANPVAAHFETAGRHRAGHRGHGSCISEADTTRLGLEVYTIHSRLAAAVLREIPCRPACAP